MDILLFNANKNKHWVINKQNVRLIQIELEFVLARSKLNKIHANVNAVIAIVNAIHEAMSSTNVNSGTYWKKKSLLIVHLGPSLESSLTTFELERHVLELLTREDYVLMPK